jgi:hypothetical protein
VSWEGHDVYVSPIGETTLGPRQRIGRHDKRMIKSASLSVDGALVSSGDEMEVVVWSRSRPGVPLMRFPANWWPALFDLERLRFFVSRVDHAATDSHRLWGPAEAKPLMYPAWGSPAVTPNGGWVAQTKTIPDRDAFRSHFYPMHTVWPFQVNLGLENVSEGHYIAFLPDGQSIASERDGQLVLTELSMNGRPSRVVFETPGRRLRWHFSFDPKGECMLAGTHLSGAWMVPLDGSEAFALEHAPSYTAATAFNPSGDRIALGGGSVDLAAVDRRVLEREGRLLARMETGRLDDVRNIGFLTEAELIVATGGGLWWWNADNEEPA